ncbi:hypothetical protein [Paracoccus zhejiangensis]|uniref:hypothetical protein n=1 Tax=Paracoccus zhejiangensis TaxID=1077935 RepID=UPI001E497329|nr:hypothetical protein [Paracoccus zhejiangensis]
MPGDSFAVNEPILWRWSADGQHDRTPPVRRELFSWTHLAVLLAIAGFAVWLNYGSDYCLERRCRGGGFWAGLAVVTIFLAVMKLFGFGNHPLVRDLLSGLNDNRFNSYRSYLLTPTRLLRLDWDGSIESFSLREGPMVIQYGNLRIEPPQARGRTLIRKIPETVQRELFAAIQTARTMRTGQTEVPR